MKQIYLHGLGQTPSSWEKTITRLDSSAYCECPDLAKIVHGHNTSYQELFEAFSAICDQSDEKIDLCGLSLGSVLALDYAIAHPEKVNSLVLIAAQYKMPKTLLKFQNLLFRVMPKSSFQQTGFKKEAFIRLCQSMENLDFSSSLSKVDCPVLVIYGEKDRANKQAAIELARILKNAALHMIPGSGHEVNVEAPEQLAEVLSAFHLKAAPPSPKNAH